MTILRNTLNETTLHFVANATTVIAGNNSVSNVSFSTQEVAGASITKIIADGTWSIKRGSNVVWTSNGAAIWDFVDESAPLTLYPTANVVVEGEGAIIVQLAKESVF